MYLYQAIESFSVWYYFSLLLLIDTNANNVIIIIIWHFYVVNYWSIFHRRTTSPTDAEKTEGPKILFTGITPSEVSRLTEVCKLCL